MRKILFFILLLTSLSIHAKEFSSAKEIEFYAVKILFIDGNVETGYAELPTHETFKKSLFFKPYFSDVSFEKIKYDKIYRLIYTMGNGNKFTFERSAIYNVLKRFQKYRNMDCEDRKKQSWMLIIHQTENLIVYSLAKTYYINEEGTLVSESVEYGMWAEIVYLFKRPGESCAARIAHIVDGAKIIGRKKRFIKSASRYFAGHDSLVERIKDNEFKSEEVIKLAEAYEELFKE